MSSEQPELGQLLVYELMHAAKDVWKPVPEGNSESRIVVLL